MLVDSLLSHIRLKKISIALFSICSFFQTGFSQTVEIEDDGVKSCLVQDYPSLVDSDDKLIVVNANTFEDPIVCKDFGIDFLSDFQYFTSLKELNVSENNIAEVASLNVLNKLESLDVSINSLEDTLDLYGLVNLVSLDLSDNDIKQIDNISLLTKLEVLDLHLNDLPSLSDLDNSVNLKEVDLSENRFQDLPSFSLSSLELLSAGDNKLTFEDFLVFADLDMFPASFPDLEDQAMQSKADTSIVMENKSWSWHLSFDHDVTSNIYYWYKDGEPIDTSQSYKFDGVKVSLSDSGSYTCEVLNTHPLLSDFKILTFVRTLIVLPDTTTQVIDTTIVEPHECFEVVDLNMDLIVPNCSEVAFLTIDPEVIGTVDGQLLYLVNNEPIDPDQMLTIYSEGLYTIEVIDEVCSNYTNTFEVTFDLSSCIPRSFSPNGDGLEDEFYIEQEGLVKILDRSGHLVLELIAPAFWDGKSQTGDLVDTGLYIYVTEDGLSESVTVMR